jgi:hypothetical protein
MSSADLALTLFTALSVVRVIAYVPQIVRIARDTHGAEAISCVSWAMFAFANLSTAAYAVLAVDDALMAWLFGANFAACLAVLGLTAWKRVGRLRNACRS